MAQRRMFSLSVVDTDRFLVMPASAQALYFHMGMKADDEGFVSSPRKAIVNVGCTADDLELLIDKGFIIPFDSGICVVADWKLNNLIKSDRFRASIYLAEKALLVSDSNGSYALKSQDGAQTEPNCSPNGTQLEPQVRLGKDRLDKDRLPEAVSAPGRPEPPQAEIMLADGTSFPVYPDDVAYWEKLYPAVDILQALRKMAGWCEANPRKRKTRAGARRFINSWLAREQDRAGAADTPATAEQLYGGRFV